VLAVSIRSSNKRPPASWRPRPRRMSQIFFRFWFEPTTAFSALRDCTNHNFAPDACEWPSGAQGGPWADRPGAHFGGIASELPTCARAPICHDQMEFMQRGFQTARAIKPRVGIAHWLGKLRSRKVRFLARSWSLGRTRSGVASNAATARRKKSQGDKSCSSVREARPPRKTSLRYG
jgi:hypothetical protein